MSRQIIRDWKRSMASGLAASAEPAAVMLAKESALALLQRSVAFGHGKLAVLRLAMAVTAGAEVPEPHWTYCRQAASKSRDPRLRALLQGADRAANRKPAHSDSVLPTHTKA